MDLSFVWVDAELLVGVGQIQSTEREIEANEWVEETRQGKAFHTHGNSAKGLGMTHFELVNLFSLFSRAFRETSVSGTRRASILKQPECRMAPEARRKIVFLHRFLSNTHNFPIFFSLQSVFSEPIPISYAHEWTEVEHVLCCSKTKACLSDTFPCYCIGQRTYTILRINWRRLTWTKSQLL